MKTPYAVWESEYPDEGSNLIFAATENGARRKYRRLTGERATLDDLVPLSVMALSVDAALALARSAQ